MSKSGEVTILSEVESFYGSLYASIHLYHYAEDLPEVTVPVQKELGRKSAHMPSKPRP